jgi:hypothetical protein
LESWRRRRLLAFLASTLRPSNAPRPFFAPECSVFLESPTKVNRPIVPRRSFQPGRLIND